MSANRPTLDVEFDRRNAQRADLMGQRVVFGGRERIVHYTRWSEHSRLEVQLEPGGPYFDAGSMRLVEWKPLTLAKRREFIARINAARQPAGSRSATLADVRARMTGNGPKGVA